MQEPHNIHVLIPTGGRPETIYATLRSCATQTYEHLVVWICDNSFSPETAAAVAQINDRRFRLIRPNSRLCMAENWEFALSHIEDGFVTIIGDDDCLMPGSIEKVAELIKDYPEISIFNHLPASYYWPNFPNAELASKLYIQPIDFTIRIRDSKEILSEVCSFDSWYGHLPVLYHGFVAAKLINEIKNKSDGIFFKFCAPDIYAAIVLAMHTNQFVRVQTALTIGGQSAKSNGANYALGTEVGKMFVAELPARLRFRYESMSISLAIYEALENALEAFPDQAQIATIDKDKLISQSISDVKDLGPQKKEELLEKLLMIYPVQTVNDALRQADLTSERETFNTELVQKSWWLHIIQLLRRIKSRLPNMSSERHKERISATVKLDDLPKSFYVDAGFLKLHKHIDIESHGVRTVDQAALFLQAELESAKFSLDLRNKV
jgi:glycosyltransferase involved in cell wall biosynthesis